MITGYNFARTVLRRTIAGFRARLAAPPLETAEGLALRVQEAMQTMIATHQRGEDLSQLLLSRVYDQYSLEDKLV